MEKQEEEEEVFLDLADPHTNGDRPDKPLNRGPQIETSPSPDHLSRYANMCLQLSRKPCPSPQNYDTLMPPID